MGLVSVIHKKNKKIGTIFPLLKNIKMSFNNNLYVNNILHSLNRVFFISI